MITRTYKFLLKPTPEQKIKIDNQIRECNIIKNMYITDYINGVKLPFMVKESLTKYMNMRKEFYNCDKSALINTLFTLKDVFDAKKPITTNYKLRSFRITFLRGGFSPKIIDDRNIYIPHIGNVKFVMHRSLPDDCQLITLSVIRQRDGNYYACIAFKAQEKDDIKKLDLDNSIGFDYSTKHLIVGSDGFSYFSPKYYLRDEYKLKEKQNELLHCRTSHSRRIKKSEISKMHIKIKNKRRDYLHKLSYEIAEKYDYVFVENLDINEIAKRQSITKATYDNSYSMFLKMLDYKMSERGKQLVKIDRWFPSSKRCSKCGFVLKELELSTREWSCPNCGTHHDRDINAAINIKEEGKRISLLP